MAGHGRLAKANAFEPWPYTCWTRLRHLSMCLARGENWSLNVIFVFLLAKLIASWLLESCLREKKGHVRCEDEKESLAIPGEEGFGSWVVL